VYEGWASQSVTCKKQTGEFDSCGVVPGGGFSQRELIVERNAPHL